MKTNWPTKKLGVYILLVIIGILVVVSIFEFQDLSSQFNIVALILTFGVLLWYAYDTHRIAEQTIESNLRPIILRTGLNLNWNFRSVKDSENENSVLMEIKNLKNIATDIHGHIVLSGKKHLLLFGGDFSSGNQTNSKTLKRITFIDSFGWQWLPSGGYIYVSYDSGKYEESALDNEIYLEYRDVEGNRYYTRESSDYIQKTGRHEK